MNLMNPPILIFSEDPGATNCILPLLPLLVKAGMPFRLLAAGVAAGMYARQGYTAETVPEDITALFSGVAPALVLTGTAANPDTPGLQLIKMARKLCIPAMGVVDASMNAERRFSGRSDNSLAYAPDWIAVPDRITAERFELLGADTNRVVICGHPHFDAVMTRAQELRQINPDVFRKQYFPDVDPGRKLILFAGEPETHHRRSDGYLLQGRGGCDGRIAIVMEEFLDAVSRLSPRPACVLQLHPRSRIDDLGSLAPEFDRIQQGGDSLEILSCVDGAAGLTSMLLTEAALLGRPTLSILPRMEEKDWLPSIGWGATECVTDRAALPDALRRLVGKGTGPDAAARLIRGADRNLLDLIKKVLLKSKTC